MASKEKSKLESRLDGIDGNKKSLSVLPPIKYEEGNEPPEMGHGQKVPVRKQEQDNRLMRDGENGVELYARIVQLPKNNRVVIVCPYMDGWLPGRMVVPKRGRERKIFEQTKDGLKEKTIPGKFSKRGAKLWVRPVGEEKGLYEFVK